MYLAMTPPPAVVPLLLRHGTDLLRFLCAAGSSADVPSGTGGPAAAPATCCLSTGRFPASCASESAGCFPLFLMAVLSGAAVSAVADSSATAALAFRFFFFFLAS
jgi:hypothetical protein